MTHARQPGCLLGRHAHQHRLALALGVMVLLLPAGMALSAPDAGLPNARANAKAALMLALEELQKCAGPDQRVTARADLLDENIANPRLTGVWDSWEIKATAPPQPSDYERPAKEVKFRGWLVSNIDPGAARQVAFASQALANPATLWGTGSLGNTAPVSSIVTAPKVPVSAPDGAYAWAILDEGVKVRVNTPYTDAATSVAARTSQLGSGERPGVEFIPGLGGLSRSYFESGTSEFADLVRGIGDANFGLTAERLAPGAGAALKSLSHDVTLHSMGLFTDTARGGFKQDFQLLTNATSLPALYNGKGVYSSRLGMTSISAPSNPTWASMQQFSRLYRDKLTSSGILPVLKTQIPSKWVAATTSGDPQSGQVMTINRTPPAGVVLMPTIAKVQMLFSLVGRDLYANLPDYIQRELTPAEKAYGIHGPEDGNYRDTKYNYDLHLLYMPIVTLHNPYNVAIECSDLRVEFVNVPFAMKIFRSGEAQSTGMVPFQTMYADNVTGQQSKLFGMNLKDKGADGKPGGATFRLLPGEVKVFSPYLDPERTYREDLGDRRFWDIYLSSGFTNNMDTIPGWRGDGVGYDCNWVTGNQPVDQDFSKGHWGGDVGMAWDDEIYVEFTPYTTFPSTLPGSSMNKFVVQMSVPSSSWGRTIVSAIEMDYESPTGLQALMTSTGVPLPMRYPKTGTIKGVDLVDRALVKIKDLKYPKPFALLSVQAKSTNGARDTTGEDGRIATKPWCFAHANIGASSQKVISEHPANFSHEFNLQLIENGTANLLAVDSNDRGNFISGQGAINGTKFGVQYDIPLAPLQTLASLNGANPGGCSGYLPRFAQPIGNSWAHPLIAPTHLMETKTGGNYLDHSFLLNLALYDGFYFSGLASQTGIFGTGKSTANLATSFAASQALDDPRLLLYRPNGKPASAFASATTASTAYANIAAWQLMKGAFNINSTSVPAWKAMLASIHDAEAVLNKIDKTAGSSAIMPLAATSVNEVRISRFRLPASASAAAGAEPKDAYWLGPREYSDAQLQTLAENIVKQVRLRGPFLSMAEFVNRRLGSGDTAQRGALQQAIDDSNLNQPLASAAGAGFEIPADVVTTYKYVNATAGTGASYQGAPGYLTQADLLNVLGNAATARSDTFVIRSYGEAHDASGQITASAICEAVVQRLPDWYDPADLAETAPAALVSESNKTLGRRFRLLAFRWLTPGEI